MPTNEEPTTIEVCIDCASLLANGEVTDSLGEDATFEHAAKIERQWGNVRLTLGSSGEPEAEEAWFSHSPCDGCGSSLGGNRVHATAWHPLSKVDPAAAQ